MTFIARERITLTLAEQLVLEMGLGSLAGCMAILRLGERLGVAPLPSRAIAAAARSVEEALKPTSPLPPAAAPACYCGAEPTHHNEIPLTTGGTFHVGFCDDCQQVYEGN